MTTGDCDRGAIFSDDRRYRYRLWRICDRSRRQLLWVMLNPSTADARDDDPTLRRCLDFSQQWGYGGLEVVNLFAYISSGPQKLFKVSDPVGSENDQYITDAAVRAADMDTDIVVAWGERGVYRNRDCEVLDLLSRHITRPLLCLGHLPNGCPRHPARLSRNAVLQPYLGYKKRCH